MAWMHPDALEYQRKRWNKPDDGRWTRPDAARWQKPNPERWLSPAELQVEYPELYERKYGRSPPSMPVCDHLAVRARDTRTDLPERDWRDDPEVRRLVAEIKLDLLRLQYWRKAYNPNQPRVPAGNPDGGRWTGEGGVAQTAENQLEQALTTARAQPPRSDLKHLEAIANDPVIRTQIDTAWKASDPLGKFPQEHGFWISRDATTGDLFVRPFAGRGLADSIVPGPPPTDAIAFFHTHPNSPIIHQAAPSPADIRFANAVRLPGLLQSHEGMYYFGPSLRLPSP